MSKNLGAKKVFISGETHLYLPDNPRTIPLRVIASEGLPLGTKFVEIQLPEPEEQAMTEFKNGDKVEWEIARGVYIGAHATATGWSCCWDSERGCYESVLTENLSLIPDTVELVVTRQDAEWLVHMWGRRLIDSPAPRVAQAAKEALADG